MKNRSQNGPAHPIDFVIAWVDGGDAAWLKEKQDYAARQNSAYSKKWTSGDNRYRDWGLLRYWFRGVETFAPWCSRIWFVTWGHYPAWLNTAHPKLRIVRHDEFIPAKYLPTFSSHTIELNLHRIKDLSEHFVYFNDDMFLTAPVKPTDFFVGGKPCDSAVLLPIRLEQNGIRAEINDMYVINAHFDKRKTMHRHFADWYSPVYGKLLLRTLLLTPFSLFPGFYVSHLPCAYRKQTFFDVWQAEEACLDTTCSHRFREVTDVNQWLMEYWQFCTGFHPRTPDIGRYYEGQASFDEMCRAVRAQRYRMVCCNDSPDIIDFPAAASALHQAFDSILPHKSTFERN